MRVLLTTDTVGGVWTFTRELTDHLLQRGHAVALVSFGRDPNEGQKAWIKKQASAFGSTFNFRGSDAPLEWMQENDRAYSGGSEVLVSLAKDFGAEILHANQFCWGALPHTMPCVITAHSDVLSWADACQNSALEQSSWLQRYTALVQQGLSGADCVVAPTRWMASALQTHFDVPCGVSSIYNGRSLASKTASTSRKLQAVSVGRLWDEAKGLQTLVELDAPIPLLIAGENSFESVAARTHSLQALGALSEEELMTLFSSSSIYIAASVYEPFGLAPLEAAICGCVIVARDLPSLHEVWEDAALFFRTTEELCAILVALKTHPEMVCAQQQKARSRALQFTAERMADSYEALYVRLIDRRRSFANGKEPVIHAA